jgi:Domain of unknown function (DUF6468)
VSAISAIGAGIDVVMMCTLGVTIFYGLRLSKRFEALRADREAFDRLIAALNLAASKADLAIKSLRQAAIETGDGLTQKIAAARALAEELEIVVEAGDNLADRLSNLAEKSRKASMPEASDEPQPRTKAERELLDAVKARQGS